jgi:hypothetical protein
MNCVSRWSFYSSFKRWWLSDNCRAVRQGVEFVVLNFLSDSQVGEMLPQIGFLLVRHIFDEVRVYVGMCGEELGYLCATLTNMT